MGCGRPVQVDPRRSPRRGWGQIGSHEPTLEGSFRGNRLSRGHQEQLHTDQASSPSGVLAAQLYGGLHHLGGRREGGRAVAVVWRDAVATAEPKPPEETANGGARQAQGRDDLTGPAALFPEPEHRLTDRDRDGTWHGQTSQKHYHESNCPILYQCRDAIKPGVGISRSNLVSRDKGVSYRLGAHAPSYTRASPAGLFGTGSESPGVTIVTPVIRKTAIRACTREALVTPVRGAETAACRTINVPLR
jgi:hypothetical protein